MLARMAVEVLEDDGRRLYVARRGDRVPEGEQGALHEIALSPVLSSTIDQGGAEERASELRVRSRRCAASKFPY